MGCTGSAGTRNTRHRLVGLVGLVGLVICANSWLALALALLMGGAYLLMALVEEAWLEQQYGRSYKEYCARTARFFDAQGLILAVIDKKQRARLEPAEVKSR